jgi:nitrite reductase/ring-hydroxylating ferredoxin subunit
MQFSIGFDASVRFFLLEKLINLYDGYRRVFKIDERQLLLIQENDELYLIEALCPHRGHPLDSAMIQNNTVRCPLHGYQFALRDGSLRAASEETCRALRRYDVVYRNTDLGVML